MLAIFGLWCRIKYFYRGFIVAITRKYKVLLDNKLNQLMYQGYVKLERWELRSWYGRDRLTNVVWRDITESWESLFEDTAPTLKIIKCDETTAPQQYLLLNSDQIVDLETLA